MPAIAVESVKRIVAFETVPMLVNAPPDAERLMVMPVALGSTPVHETVMDDAPAEAPTPRGEVSGIATDGAEVSADIRVPPIAWMR